MSRYVIVVEAGPDGDRGVESVHGVDGGGVTSADVRTVRADLLRYLADSGLVNPRATIVKLTDVPTRVVSSGTVAFGGRVYPATRQANGVVHFERVPGHVEVAAPRLRDSYQVRDAR
jgi:hypothetical protein